VRRLSLTAAGGLALLLLALALAANGRAKSNVVHTCSVVDRQFILTARTNMTAIGLWGEQYQSGDATAAEVVEQAQQAARIMRGVSPTDPSLAQTRGLMVGMLSEYARAVKLQAKHRDAGPEMYRAYGLANYAHDVLAKARPALAKRGCDLDDLL